VWYGSLSLGWKGWKGTTSVNLEAIIRIFSLGMFECASVDVSRRGYFTEKDVRGLKVYWNRIRFVHLLPGRARFGHAFLDAVQASGRCIDRYIIGDIPEHNDFSVPQY
jgi:hypothetical protein